MPPSYDTTIAASPKTEYGLSRCVVRLGEVLVDTGVTIRTVSVGGDCLDIALEDLFWTSLEEIAATQGLTTSQLVAWIDRLRHGGNLSSAIRVYVVDHFMAQAHEIEDEEERPARLPPQRPRWLN